MNSGDFYPSLIATVVGMMIYVLQLALQLIYVRPSWSVLKTICSQSQRCLSKRAWFHSLLDEQHRLYISNIRLADTVALAKSTNATD
jgi:hypothetical protein